MQTTQQSARVTAALSSEFEERWLAIVRDHGQAIAAADPDGRSLTYAQLDAQSDVLAEEVRAVLASDGILADTPVASLLGHDRRYAIAAIADLKFGRPDLGLDPGMPLERLRAIVNASGAQVIVSTPEFREIAEQLQPAAVVVMDEMDGPAAEPGYWPAIALDDVSGISYTSGSTGVPKGVAVGYRTISHELEYRTQRDWIRPGDAVAIVLPLSFGVARGELIMALLTGATLHFFDPRERGAGPLPAWLTEHEISVLTATPSLLTAIVRALEPGERLTDSLRLVRSAGEKVLCSEALSIKRALPPTCRFFNAFGSSEATLISAFEITDETPDIPRPVPAGWPISGFEIRFEREDGTAPDPGEVAEVIVVSRFLPLGYRRDAERTRLKYLPLEDGRVALATGDLGVALADGSFRLAGRKDLSLKIRGNLVEPAEVESALLHCDGVSDAVVVGRPTPAGRERLTAYVVLRRDADVVRTTEIRRSLRRTLPTYMIPETVVFLTELPRNERGKLDRSALPDPPDRVAADIVPPRTPWEERVAALWSEVLGLETLSIDDDFFDLGGDSLAAEELVTRLAVASGIQVSSRILLDAPTVAEFAAAVTANEAAPSDRLVAIMRTGERPPLFCVTGAGRLGLTYLPLAKRLGIDQPLWALQDGRREERRIPEWSIRRMARRNVEAIRAEYPNGPYLLAGHSLGGVVAFEMAQQLRAAGHQVPLLIALDSFPPHPSARPPVRRRSPAEWIVTVKRYAAILSGRALTSRPLAAGVDRPASGFYTRQAHLVSLLYRGRAYSGRTLVVIAGDDPSPVAGGWHRGRAWKPYLCGPWRIEETPGIHSTMLNEPHVATLAEVVRAEITEALQSMG